MSGRTILRSISALILASAFLGYSQMASAAWQSYAMDCSTCVTKSQFKTAAKNRAQQTGKAGYYTVVSEAQEKVALILVAWEGDLNPPRWDADHIQTGSLTSTDNRTLGRLYWGTIDITYAQCTCSSFATHNEEIVAGFLANAIPPATVTPGVTVRVRFPDGETVLYTKQNSGIPWGRQWGTERDSDGVLMSENFSPVNPTDPGVTVSQLGEGNIHVQGYVSGNSVWVRAYITVQNAANQVLWTKLYN